MLDCGVSVGVAGTMGNDVLLLTGLLDAEEPIFMARAIPPIANTITTKITNNTMLLGHLLFCGIASSVLDLACCWPSVEISCPGS